MGHVWGVSRHWGPPVLLVVSVGVYGGVVVSLYGDTTKDISVNLWKQANYELNVPNLSNKFTCYRGLLIWCDYDCLLTTC